MASLLTPFLLRQRLAAVKPYLRGAVLDLGCGGGELVACLRPDQTYTGVDWRAETVRQLQARYPAHMFHRRDFDTEPLALAERFDTVVLLAVIEHLRQPEHLFGQLAQVMTADGRAVMTSPSGWGNGLHAVGARLGLFSRAAADEHHIIFSRERLSRMVEPHGLALAGYRRFLLGGNQLFVCRRADAAP
jgi:2-polyprenyl-3-methyl-5-hydroxy-6-metoxy-1,4-benzoquinol methylase